MSKVLLITAVFSLLLTGVVSAGLYEGRLLDESGLPISGATIQTDVKSVHSVSDNDGSFKLETNGSHPTYLTITHISYQPVMFKTGNFQNGADIQMSPAVYKGQNIRVTAMRAQTGVTPAVFTDFTSDDIKRDYTVSDFPELLQSTPNFYSYGEDGGGLNASEFKIRGFDSKRIGVYLNGVPLNDPEDHKTYFYDIPDFASEVSDIQVQRGAGNSNFGHASFGGSINISTADLDRKRRISLSTGYGQFLADGKYFSDIRKQTMEYSSGLIDGKWSLAGRYSKLYSGGYREHSWYDGWAYFFSVSKLDPKMTTVINIYGGPMKAHLAYYGVDRETLSENRQANDWLSYANEIDDFNQPHYEIHNTYKVNNKIILNNTLFYINGEGYYEGYKYGKEYDEYNIPDSLVIDDSIDEIDLIRQKWVEKNQYGWNPSVDIKHTNGKLKIGGALYYFESEHWGEIDYSENVSISPHYRYYEYFTKKYSYSFYISENYKLSEKLRLFGNLQGRYLTFDFDMPEDGVYHGYKYNLDWFFFAPRLGLTYLLNDRANMFFNFSMSSREPDDKTIFDADDPSEEPHLDIDTEQVYNLEIGGNYRGDKYNLGLNLFWMEFKNEIVEKGALDNDGEPIMGNADKSVHSGVEFTGAYRPLDYLTVSGNFAYNDNKFKKYIEHIDSDYDDIADSTADYSDNPIPGFPTYLGNLTIDYNKKPFRVVYRLRAVGKQYIENNKDESYAIDNYTVSSLSLSAKIGDISGMGRFSLTARINNLFNELYETAGVVDWGEGYYFPAAERNFFIELKWDIE